MPEFLFLLVIGGVIAICIWFVKRDNRIAREEEVEKIKKLCQEAGKEVLNMASLFPICYAVIEKHKLSHGLSDDQKLYGAAVLSFNQADAFGSDDVSMVFAKAVAMNSCFPAIFMGDMVAVWHGEGDQASTEIFWRIVNASMQEAAIVINILFGDNINNTVNRKIANLVASYKVEIECNVRKLLQNPYDHELYKRNEDSINNILSRDEFWGLIRNM